MLTLMQHNTNGLPPLFPTLEALLAEPFPRTPQDMMQLEQRLSIAAAQTADQMVLIQVTRAHEDAAIRSLEMMEPVRDEGSGPPRSLITWEL